MAWRGAKPGAIPLIGNAIPLIGNAITLIGNAITVNGNAGVGWGGVGNPKVILPLPYAVFFANLKANGMKELPPDVTTYLETCILVYEYCFVRR